MAAVKSRPSSQFVVDVGHERAGFFQRHAASSGVVLEVEYDDSVLVRLDGIQKMLRLGNAI